MEFNQFWIVLDDFVDEDMIGMTAIVYDEVPDDPSDPEPIYLWYVYVPEMSVRSGRAVCVSVPAGSQVELPDPYGPTAVRS